MESGGPHVYVWRTTVVRVVGLAWLTGALGHLEYQGLNQAIGSVQAFWGGGGGDLDRDGR